MGELATTDLEEKVVREDTTELATTDLVTTELATTVERAEKEEREERDPRAVTELCVKLFKQAHLMPTVVTEAREEKEDSTTEDIMEDITEERAERVDTTELL